MTYECVTADDWCMFCVFSGGLIDGPNVCVGVMIPDRHMHVFVSVDNAACESMNMFTGQHVGVL